MRVWAGVLLLPITAIGQVNWGIVNGPWQLTGGTEAFDIARNRWVIAHGVTWEFDGVAWVARQTSVAPGVGEMEYDEARGRIVHSSDTVTYEYDGLDWRLANASGPAGYPHALVYHRGRGRVMRFGQIVINAYDRTELWEWDGVTWTHVPTSGHPPGRISPEAARYANVIHDERRDVLVIFGHVLNNGSTSTWYNDTWEWDAVTGWRSVQAGGPIRRNRTLAFDRARGVQVLVTETPDFMSGEVWERTGSGQWSRRQTPTMPTSMAGRFVTYDSVSNRVLMISLSTHTWAYAPVNPASLLVHGTGCGGGATPELRPERSWTQAWTGGVESLDLTNVPQVLAVLMMGFQDQTWAGLPLPYDLTPIGAPGCRLRIDPAGIASAAATGTVARFAITVPNQPALVGTRFFQQALVFAQGSNAAGVLVSNSLVGVVGAP